VYGIFLTEDELEALRVEHAEEMAKNGTSAHGQMAEQAKAFRPEVGIHEFANSGGGGRVYGRDRDEELAHLDGNPRLAEAGLVLKDADTLRMAARYALSLAMSEHWESGFMSDVPGCPWEDRAFRRSYVCDDIARVLDLAGEMFTDTGRLYLMRRLAEEGAGPINFVTWRHEYIFHCNQLAFFNAGRMAAYVVMERQWPRVKPYTDLAYEDTVNNLNNVIEPDGGYLEGPGYFNPTIRENYDVLKYYARARGRNAQELIPEAVKRTPDFAAVVASTTEEDAIPICDSGSEFGFSTLEILSNLLPDSYWVTVYNKKARAEGREPLPKEGPPLPHFVALAVTGHLASLRDLDGQPVKILVMGHKAGADHTHEDKGSFVLEFAGQAFAMDPGMCEYDDPIHHEYKQCQRHNMLAPVGTAERARPLRPLPVSVRPSGTGDATSFQASIDATPGWEPFYRKWVRTWDSPTADVLTIHDEYELASGDGVEFYWQTKLPCQQEGNTVVIVGERGKATVTVPEGCTVRIETLPLAEGDEQRRIAIGKAGVKGALTVRVALEATAAP
ncbi:MAG: heparinase II/III family protein, partial [Candidatus Hydrogenedentes bacterium]|nr:heparinase II/III family protein [Candidatus Hydrogenedentota bacterium]